MISIIITSIVCLTVVILTLINRFWTWKFDNPYTDEEHQIASIYKDREQKVVIGVNIWYKRTYKNGTVTFIHKKIWQT